MLYEIDRQQAERSLRSSEARFRLVATATSDAIWDFDLRTGEVWCNAYYEQLFGVPPASIDRAIQRWIDLLHPQDRDRVLESFNAARRGTLNRWSAEYRIRDHAGQWRHMLDRGHISRDADGRAVRLIGAMLDLTERQAGEQRLHRSEQQFRTLAMALPVLVFVIDPNAEMLDVNQRFADYIGCGADALLGRSWLQAVHPDDRAMLHASWPGHVGAGRAFECELRLRRHDGRYRWFVIRMAPQAEAGGIDRWLGTASDVDQHRQNESMLELERGQLQRRIDDRSRALVEVARQLADEIKRRDAAQTAVQRAQKLEALGQLAGGIAHDFNNVLAGVSGAIELLPRLKDDTQRRQTLERARRGVQRGSHLVRQLLNFARTRPTAPRVTELSTFLHGCADLLQHALGSGVALQFDLRDELRVIVNPHQFEVALLNLAINARDAMNGSGTLVVSAGLSRAGEAAHPVAMAPRAACITLRDDGPGMMPDVLARATEAFFTTKQHGQGTGLGLPMVRGFAHDSGGVLSIDSRSGAGTAVSIFLPLTDLPLDAIPDTTTTLIDRQLHGNATVLVLDDDELVRKATVAFLRDLGYTVIEAGEPLVAFGLALALPVLDAVITDLTMPGMSGRDFAERLRAERNVPVLFVTGRLDAAPLFGERVLEKPFTQAALAAEVARLLARVPARGDAERVAALDEQVRRINRRVSDQTMRRILQRWAECIRDGQLPLLNEIAIDGRCAPHAIVAARLDSADGAIASFKYLHVGAEFERLLGQPLSPTVSTAPDDPLLEIARAYEQVLRGGLPSYECLQLDDAAGADDARLFERLLLPVREDQSTRQPSHVIGLIQIGTVLYRPI